MLLIELDDELIFSLAPHFRVLEVRIKMHGVMQATLLRAARYPSTVAVVNVSATRFQALPSPL